MTTPAEFQELLGQPEGANVEFKSAAGSFHFDDLVQYCVALANEGGGTIVLGVTDRRPRQVVGTRAFAEPGRTEAGLFERLGHRVAVEELHHDGKRILLVRVPGRLPGTAWQDRGSFWMRAGDALLPMSDDQLRRIHDETGPDFSAQVCANATIEDLDPDAIDLLRRLWQRKSPEQDVATRPAERLLADAELLVGGELTYAALILLGTHAALGRHLGQAEVVFEYRPNEVPGPAADRREFRRSFLPVLDEIWQAVALRNDLQHFQQGLFVWDVPTFDERAVREAVLNAVSHRDYRHGGSVFVRQYPRRVAGFGSIQNPIHLNEDPISTQSGAPVLVHQALLWGRLRCDQEHDNPMNHAKKLIEVALPLGAIDKASAREKSSRRDRLCVFRSGALRSQFRGVTC